MCVKWCIGGVLGAFGASWGDLVASWGRLGGVLGRLWGVFRAFQQRLRTFLKHLKSIVSAWLQFIKYTVKLQCKCILYVNGRLEIVLLYTRIILTTDKHVLNHQDVSGHILRCVLERLKSVARAS